MRKLNVLFTLHATAGEVFPFCSYPSPEHQIPFQRNLHVKL